MPGRNSHSTERSSSPVAAGARVNGPHDVGGVQGLGPVPGKDDDQVFHEPWEGQVHGTMLSAAVSGAFMVDEARARVEELHPIAYLKMSYYEQWLYSLETNLLAHGVLTVDEIEDRLRTLAAAPDTPLPAGENDELLGIMKMVIAHGAPITREVDAVPRFSKGDAVRTKVIVVDEPGVHHTRLPGYAQGQRAVIESVYAAIPLPDAKFDGADERPEHVYCLRLRSRDLWPDAGERDNVFVDAWESYLEPADGSADDETGGRR